MGKENPQSYTDGNRILAELLEVPESFIQLWSECHTARYHELYNRDTGTADPRQRPCCETEHTRKADEIQPDELNNPTADEISIRGQEEKFSMVAKIKKRKSWRDLLDHSASDKSTPSIAIQFIVPNDDD